MLSAPLKSLALAIAGWLTAQTAVAGPIYSQAALGPTTRTVTFSEVTVNGSPAIQNQFSSLGVSFAKSANAAVWRLGSAPTVPARLGLTGVVLTSSTGNSGNASDYLSILFASDVSAAGAYFLFNVSSTPLTIQAYNDGVLVDSFSYVNSNSAKSTFLGFKNELFDELRIGNLGRNRGVMLDSLSFTNAVPEPSSMALAALVMGGLFFTRRRGQR